MPRLHGRGRASPEDDDLALAVFDLLELRAAGGGPSGAL